ncbi:MAG: nucleotidyltransferase domain-containing protein [Armatimonadota bacterium]|nr:nucleotidyltransferase domain-containing protein [Armatimonadota bacterium]
MSASDEQLQEVVRRIVEAAHPIRIILFGSTARGEAGPVSDVDVLVVVPDGTHRLDTAENVYLNLHGFRVDVDVVVATESDIAKYKDSPGLVYREAVREGRTLYAA